MKSTFMEKTVKTITACAAVSLLFASCQFIGLGDATDLTAPEVTITDPSSMGNVSATYTVKGTASDNVGVTSLTMTCSTTGQIWKYTSSSGWQYLKSSSSSWTAAAGTWEGSDTSAAWSVDISLIQTSTDSNYTLTTTVTDNAGNNSSSSTDERVVILDTTPPVVTVTSPHLENAASDMNSWKYPDASTISYLVNGDFTVTGITKDDSTLSEIKLYLKSADGTDTYYSASITDTSKTRNWSFSVPAAEVKNGSNVLTNKNIIEVYIETTDAAGNFQKLVCGYFCYWPEADTPWLETSFGYDSQVTAESSDKVYPTYKLQGQAYDDDGVETVTAQMYSIIGSTKTSLSSSPVSVYTASSSYPSYVSWSVTAPSDNGTYEIVLSITDRNRKKGKDVTKYFAVQDINAPVLSTDGSSSSAIGDANGNITIKGTANDDSTSLTLDIAFIKSGSNLLASQITYLDGSNSAWNSASSNGYADGSGNKLYTCTLSKTSGTYASLNYYTYTKTFNIFTDLGITSSNTLTSQLFLVRLSDAQNHVVKSVSLTGDIETPAITLDTITIGGTAYNLKTTSTLPSGISGKTAVLSGTWTDDSIRSWNNKDKIGNVAVSWSDAGVITTSKTWDSSSETGTWTSDSFTMPDVTAATITASITDWGGNTGSAQGSFYVNSNEPQLVRISSTNSDGSYKAGDVITITTEFNKAMTFSGGSTDPVLSLSNGGTAAYSSGNGTSRHLYTYTVQTKEANSSVESADLSVSSFSTNGNIWKDSVGAALNTSASTTLSIPSGSNLADIRTIVIDVTAPAISSIQPVTSGGTYKAGKTLYFRATMSEDVTIGSGTNPTLTLGGFTGNTVTRTTAAATVTGTKTLMFSYTTASGDTNSGLTVTAFTAGTASITDAAGNTLSTVLPAMSPSGLVIDTTVPGVPSIVCAVASGSSTYAAASFTVTYGETGGTRQYSLDGGSSWSSYTSSVSLSSTGTYRITARQTDAAGNTSDTASVYTVTVDSAPLLEYITSTQSDGTYTYHTGTAAGDTIPIMLHFRKNMTVTGTPTLTINTTAGTSAVSYTSGSGSSVLEFDYTVASGDTTSGAALTVKKLNLTAADCITDGTINVGTYLPSSQTDLNAVNGGNLAANRTIYIQTGNPSCSSVAVSGIDDSAKLIITFDRSIIKNSGNITLTQTSAELAPAVLSATDYATYASYSTETKTVLEKYYTKSTNGSDSGGTSDTTAKYVLDYACSADDSALVTALDTAGMFKRTIPVTSSAVTISGSVMTIALTGSYAVPVNGAAYTCVVPAAIVTDSLGNTNTTAKTETGLIAPGVEAPVIRIDKELESITVSGSAPTAVQPLTTACKIDCQTAGASLAYTLTQTTSTTRSLSTYHLPTEAGGTTHVMAADYDEAASANQTLVTATGSAGSSTSYTRGNTITLGSSADYTTGYTYLIAATATYSSYTAKGYETAYRTVVQIQSLTLSNPSGATSMWLRGGDSSNGSVTTADFPLSWNTSETGKVRCMTSGTNNSLGSIYYWVTWKINTTSYVGFIAGTADAGSATTTSNGTVTAGKGPNKMCWGSCAWVSSKLKYPVYPGRSLYMPTGTFASQILGQQYGSFGFQSKHIITIR